MHIMNHALCTIFIMHILHYAQCALCTLFIKKIATFVGKFLSANSVGKLSRLKAIWRNMYKNHMKIKLQFLWENLSNQRQFEETYTKKHMWWRKNCNFCGKILKCNLRGKIFQAEGNLKKHIQKTHEEKMQLLWENFSDRRQFEETHTKNTCRKKCKFCGKSFQAKGNLKKHIHKIQPIRWNPAP